MKVTADARRRVVLADAKPGDVFDQVLEGTRIVLIKLEPALHRPAKARIEKRGRYSVGVLDQPINEQAIREALADFP